MIDTRPSVLNKLKDLRGGPCVGGSSAAPEGVSRVPAIVNNESPLHERYNYY